MISDTALSLETNEFRQKLRAYAPKVAFGYQVISDDLPEIYPEEAAQLSPNAVPKRRAEHRAGRIAARKAMKTLGVQPCPILKGDFGEPIWPRNLVGAITHTQELAISALAERQNVAGLGIDLERQDRFSAGVASAILTPEEISADIAIGAAFTAKEATYKAMFPVIRKVVGFQEVTIELSGDGQLFTAKPATPFSETFGQGEIFARGMIASMDHMILAYAELDMKYGRSVNILV